MPSGFSGSTYVGAVFKLSWDCAVCTSWGLAPGAADPRHRHRRSPGLMQPPGPLSPETSLRRSRQDPVSPQTLGWSRRCLSGSCAGGLWGRLAPPAAGPGALPADLRLQARPGEGLPWCPQLRGLPLSEAPVQRRPRKPTSSSAGLMEGGSQEGFSVPHPGPRTLGSLVLACPLVRWRLGSPRGTVLILG